MFSRFQIRRRLSLVLPALLTALTLPGLQAHAASRVAPLITQPVDNASLVKLGGGTHPLANAKNDRGAVMPSQPMSRMMMVLKRPEAQDKSLAAAIKEMQRPGSKAYHHWLTPEQIGEQYGAAPEDVAKVTGWLASAGFHVDSVSKARSVVEFSGTASQVASAFHTEMHSYAWKGGTYTANASDPQIPAALAPVVAGFAAMNNFPVKGAHSGSKVVQLDKNTHTWSTVADGGKASGAGVVKDGVRPALTTTHTADGQTMYGVTPYDFATIYNLKPLWDAGLDGTGQQIAIVAESDISTGDVDQFRSAFGLPDKHLNIVHNGDAPGLQSDQDEASIDVEWAGAIAKNATIDLVVSSSTAVSAGIYLSMTYAVDNLTAPVLSESYHTCESALGPSGNLFFYQTWQQAAAEGITVVVSAGDSAAADCDIDPFTIASNGLAVNGFASTPYNVAVGGTDFAVNVTNPTPYWGTTNDPTTQASALSYIPEVPWNNSCASPEVFAAFGGGSGDSSPAQWCDDYQLPGNYLTPEGGGGGKSSCTSFDPAAYPSRAYCAAGYAKPEWQAGVNGIPDDKVRDVPDVSLFGSYLTFGSAYLYCMTDPTYVPSCNYDTPNGLKYLASGGTSFGAPAFAGIMALINQKTNTTQGLANYYLYSIASQEFGSAAAPNTSQTNACRAGSSPGAANSCTFYDVTEGTNALPCFITSWDCINGPNGYAGVLAAYDSTPGYDRVTGLGSINVENLVNNWATLASATQPTTTTLTASTTLSSYGQPITLSGTVAPVSGSGTPPGTVSIQGMQLNQASINLTNGSYSQAVANLLPGAYDVTASYVGDGGYLNSISSPVSITVAAGTPTDTLVFSAANVRTGAPMPSSNGAIPYGDEVVATVTVQGPTASGIQPPTGSVTFSAGGTVLSTVPLTSTATGMTATYQTVAGHIASYTMTASYSGDANYNPLAALTGAYTEVQAATSIEAHASASTVATGDTVNLIASVISNSYAAPPSGSVSFTVNGTVLGTSRLASGSDPLTGVGIATTTFAVPASAIANGNNQIVATYSGDDNFLGATSTPSSFVSLSGQYPTQMSLTASSTTATNLTPVTVVATLAVNGTPVTTGSVKFLDNGNTIAQVPVVGLTPATGVTTGTATLTTRLTPGTHTIVGIYSGAGNVLHPTGGAAPPITVTAAQQTVTTSISATNDAGTPANYDVTALVVAGGSTAPTGTLTLQEPSLGASLGSVALDPSKAVSGPSPEVNITTGSQSGLIITGDFNGDGIPDVASTSMNLATQLMVSLGVGDGTFKTAVGSVVSTDPTVTTAYGLVAGDFNADGIADIAVSFAGGNTVVVMLGNGDGTFRLGQTLSVPPIGAAQSSVLGNLITADFNGDGIQDLALFNGGNYIGNIEVFFGVGDGSFGHTPTIISSIGDYDSTYAPDNIVVGDINNDGKPDLVAFIQADGEVATFLGNGDGTFQSETTYPSGNLTTSGALGDLNHDGYPDIVAPNRADQNVAVFLNNQDGTFASPVTYAAAAIQNPQQFYYPEPFSVTIADMNNDGDMDLVIANNHINQVSILYGKSSGGFQQYTPKLINTAPGPFQAIVADLNGDGSPDILVEEPTSGTIGTMLNGQTWTTMLNVPLYGATTEMETMTAAYSGDSVNLASISAPLILAGSGSKVVTKLDWTPATSSVTFGMTVPADTLNAQVEHNVPGTIAYSAQTALGATIPVAAGDSLPGAGTYALTAAFTPTSTTDYAPSTASAAFTVAKASVSETLTASAIQSAPGAAVTLTDTVVSTTSMTTVPTGIVTFFAGTTSLGSATLDSTGAATISTASLPAGTVSVTASYLGDGNFNPGIAAAVSIVIGTPGIALSVDEPAITLTAGSSGAETVSATAQLGYTGNVTFACGNLPPGVTCLFAPATGAVGAATLQSTMTVSVLAPASGSTSQSAAIRSSAGSVLAASSAAVASIFLIGFTNRRRRMTWLVVLVLMAGTSALIGCSGGSTKATMPVTPAGPDATTLALGSSAIKSASGSFVTLTAKLAGTNASSATGSVTFYDGTSQIGEADVASGSASLSLNTLSVGAHGITAKYAGDSLNQSSASGSGFEQVITGQTSFTVTATSGSISQSSVINLTLQ